tara:strand:- start:974 stop:1141 length:168 start_codon:yes stop_codon:yes gene_type:complete
MELDDSFRNGGRGMIGWFLFLGLTSMLLWWLGGLMLPQQPSIIPEPNNLLRGDDE